METSTSGEGVGKASRVASQVHTHTHTARPPPASHTLRVRYGLGLLPCQCALHFHWHRAGVEPDTEQAACSPTHQTGHSRAPSSLVRLHCRTFLSPAMGGKGIVGFRSRLH